MSLHRWLLISRRIQIALVIDVLEAKTLCQYMLQHLSRVDTLLQHVHAINRTNRAVCRSSNHIFIIYAVWRGSERNR
jgi:hypothetical protein